MAILISTIVDMLAVIMEQLVYMAILISTIDVNLTKLPQTLRRRVTRGNVVESQGATT